MRSFIVTMVQGGHQGVPTAFMPKTHGHFGGHEGHLGTLKNQNCQERSQSQNFDYMNPLEVETHAKHVFSITGADFELSGDGFLPG